MTSRADAPLHVVIAPGSGLMGERHYGGIIDVLHEIVMSGYPPGLSLALVDRAGIRISAWGGFACIVGEQTTVTPATLFDLASLTKVVATVPLALILQEHGQWSLEDPVANWVPGFPRHDLTLWHLCTHTSGLPPHRPFYRLGRGQAVVRRALFSEALTADPPGTVQYSDLNFILLGWAAARCGAAPLDRLFRDRVAGPMGMRRTRFCPPPLSRHGIAATERDGDQRSEPGLIWGTVHDGNAFALGGVAGHAGLFGPTSDLATYVRLLLDPQRHPVLTSSSIAAMTTPQAGSPPDVRGFGWRLDPAGWGDWPTSTYWHTGFTGTSLLVSPRAGVAVVLCSNGVHPRRRNQRQADFRARVHRAVAAACR